MWSEFTRIRIVHDFVFTERWASVWGIFIGSILFSALWLIRIAREKVAGAEFTCLFLSRNKEKEKLSDICEGDQKN